MTPPAHSGSEENVRFLLTNNPARSYRSPWCQVYGIPFERFPWPFWQTVGPVSGPSQCTDSSEAFEPRPPALRCKSPCSWSGISLWTCQAWVALQPQRSLSIAPKIIETIKPYHEGNVGTQTAGLQMVGLFERVACRNIHIKLFYL